MYKKFLLVGVAFLGLSACEDPKPTPPRAAQPLPVDTSSNTDLNRQLMDAINAKPVQGGNLIARPVFATFEIEQGQSASETITLTNEGDAPLGIKSVGSPGVTQGDITLSGSCTTEGRRVPQGQSCELIVTATARDSRQKSGIILIQTDSSRSEQIRINYTVDIKLAPAPIPAELPPVVINQAPVPQGPPDDSAFRQALLEAQARRWQSQQGFSGIGANGMARPQVIIRRNDPRYDPDQVPWTESSLSVNRSRIITADRIITAVLETPVGANMCNQVVAIVQNHVYSPDNVNVLIPAGTRALGRCKEFNDERANIQWFRMITPNGVNITFTSLLADTNDMSGRGGVPGRVQERAYDRYVAPLLASGVDLLSVGARAAFGKDQTTTVSGLGTVQQSRSRWDAAIDDFNSSARGTIQRSLREDRKSVV